jgi:hypothetical protein
LLTGLKIQGLKADLKKFEKSLKKLLTLIGVHDNIIKLLREITAKGRKGV